jgi:transcription antitermination factor NusG
MSAAPSWYVVYTNPNCERRAVFSLMCKGFKTFYPQTRRYVRSGRVRRISERALFTRYLFVLVEPGQVRAEIRNCDGVQGIVCGAGDSAAVIPADTIETLMEAEMNGAFDETTKGLAPPTPTQELRTVMNGKLGDLASRIKAARSDDRLSVVLAEAGLIDQRAAA